MKYCNAGHNPPLIIMPEGDAEVMEMIQNKEKHSPRTVTEIVLEDLERFTKDAEQSDDITILCCRLSDIQEDQNFRQLVLKNNIEEITRLSEFIVIYTLLTHKADFNLSFDNLFFLINRIEMMDTDLMAIEPEETTLMLDRFLNS